MEWGELGELVMLLWRHGLCESKARVGARAALSTTHTHTHADYGSHERLPMKESVHSKLCQLDEVILALYAHATCLASWWCCHTHTHLH